MAIIKTRWHREVYLPAMVEMIGAYQPIRPEALKILDECRRKGIKTAVYSDYGCVTEKLAALHIDPSQFAFLVEAPSLGLLKPSAKAARKVVEMLEVAPEETLFVGDRDEKDGRAARSVGAQFYLLGD